MPPTVLRRLHRRVGAPPVVSACRASVRALTTLLLAGGFLSGVAMTAPAGEPSGSDATLSETEVEYRVKAAFLYHFVQYTSWPEEAFDEEDDPIVLAVVGPDPFRNILDDTIAGKKVGGRPIVIQRLDDASRVVEAHVAFTSGDSRTERALLERTRERPVLLVGDRDGFAKLGAQAGFYLADGKVRFAVNVRALERSRLRMSSELLKLARIVDGKEVNER